MRTLSCAVLALVMRATVSYAENPVLTTQDHIDIQYLYAQYNQTVDSGDPEGWADTFTADGVFNTTKGRAALVKTATGSTTGPNAGRTRHMNMSLIVKGTSPTTATGRVYMMLMDHGVTPPVPVMTGVYEDELVKTAEGWRFTRRTLKTDPRVAAK
ncbi:MAG: nuclear transport factor 2 family protein [Acidimicrobiia bacterium]|nr:nuclear transport factor 2 family protein [Acidimicrobiia bacterium]